MQEEALGVLDESLNMIVFTLVATVVLSSLTGKTFQKNFFCMVCLADKIFHSIDPMGKLYQNISIYLQQLNSLVCMSPVIFLYK